MTEEIKVSNTYELVTLNPVKIDKSVVKEVNSLSTRQREALLWELIADKNKTIRARATIQLIKEIKDSV